MDNSTIDAKLTYATGIDGILKHVLTFGKKVVELDSWTGIKNPDTFDHLREIERKKFRIDLFPEEDNLEYKFMLYTRLALVHRNFIGDTNREMFINNIEFTKEMADTILDLRYQRYDQFIKNRSKY